jgi:hypothetical protein
MVKKPESLVPSTRVFHDPGDLLRARVRKAAALHTVTAGSWLVTFGIAFVVLHSEGRFAFLLLAIPTVAGIALAAAEASLCLSPDPQRTSWLCGTAAAWFRNLSPKGRAWAFASVFFGGLLSMGVAIPDLRPDDSVSILALFGRLFVLVVGYVAYAGVLCLLGYESEGAYRSRVGMPPLRKPESTPPAPPSPLPEIDDIPQFLQAYRDGRITWQELDAEIRRRTTRGVKPPPVTINPD